VSPEQREEDEYLDYVLSTLTPPELTSYGYKRVFAIEENLRGMIEKWPVEHLLVVSRTCKIPQPGPEHFRALEVKPKAVDGWYPDDAFDLPKVTDDTREWEAWAGLVKESQRRVWRAFLSELRDVFREPGKRNPFRLGGKVAEWFRVVEFRWYQPGLLKINSIHTHELWAMRDPVGLRFDHEQHRLWRQAEKLKDFRAAKRHMMARRPSPGLSEVWKNLGHASKAYALHGRFDCFPAYVDPRYKDGVKALVNYFTKYLTGQDFVSQSWEDWKGKQIIPENAKGLRVWSTSREFSKKASTTFAWNGTKSTLNRARLARLAEIAGIPDYGWFKHLFGGRWHWWLSELIASVNVYDLDPNYLASLRLYQIGNAISWLEKLGDGGLNRLLLWPPVPNRQANSWPSPTKSRESLNLRILVEALQGVWSKPGPFFVPGHYGMGSLPFVFGEDAAALGIAREYALDAEEREAMRGQIESRPLDGSDGLSERPF
jgi:hypothetical protein